MEAKKINKKRPELAKSEIVAQLPMACTDERSAVEFIEARRWGNTPGCAKCGSVRVYQMTDGKNGGRNARFLWRCRDCHKMYTVRTGTVFEESLIPLKHWCYAFWRISTSKKGVAAMEIMRQCQISYKSALFMMHRVRFALAPKPGSPKKFKGIVEADETYCGGKPRPYDGKQHLRGKGTSKTPVMGIVERDGNIHRRVLPNVGGKALKDAIRETVDPSATIMTDEANMYNGIGDEFAGGHETVCHSAGEYARGEAHTNTAESGFALIKRSLMGIYHSVSKKHLHRYLAEYDFRWNVRKMNDGDRTVLAIQSAEGKRLFYKKPISKPN
jgi:transposase-like protein